MFYLSFVFTFCQSNVNNMFGMMMIFCGSYGNIYSIYLCTTPSDQRWSLQLPQTLFCLFLLKIRIFLSLQKITILLTFLSKSVSFFLFSDPFLCFSSWLIITCEGLVISLWFSLCWVLTHLFWNIISISKS